MKFAKYIEVFLSEKGIESEELMEVEGPSGRLNMIPVGCLVEAMKSAPAHEQAGIKKMLVLIDFKNGNVRHYLKHLAQAIAL
jgi:hypothetical protein